ncbi:MAG: UDP-N-acetylmuramate--L-alanine ligase, partial [Bacteroidetes bacterium]
MSALARYCQRVGKAVCGYDRTASVVTEALEAEGMEVHYDMDPAQLEGVDLMIYTPAISRDSLLYQAAEAQGIPILKRSQLLGQISQGYRTLAVAGTHGKTTTSAMLAHLLHETGMAPTAFLGGITRSLQSNFVSGDSDWLVVEADEYDRSFLTLNPELAIINSLDPDH